jgi:hypothetical protein
MKILEHTNCFLVLAALIGFCFVVCLWSSGCGEFDLSGYSDDWLYPQDVSSVYLEMFDSASFQRGHEYILTDALAKRIEAQTPYKIVSNRNRADTILSGTDRQAAYRQRIGQCVRELLGVPEPVG